MAKIQVILTQNTRIRKEGDFRMYEMVMQKTLFLIKIKG